MLWGKGHVMAVLSGCAALRAHQGMDSSTGSYMRQWYALEQTTGQGWVDPRLCCVARVNHLKVRIQMDECSSWIGIAAPMCCGHAGAARCLQCGWFHKKLTKYHARNPRLYDDASVVHCHCRLRSRGQNIRAQRSDWIGKG